MNRNGWMRPQMALAAAQKYQADRQQLPLGGRVGDWVSDLMGSGSGGHGGSYSGGGSSPGSCFSIDICPDIILAVIAAAAAAAVYLLYTTITAGRKKRSSNSGPWGGLADFLNLGRRIVFWLVQNKPTSHALYVHKCTKNAFRTAHDIKSF